LNTKTLAKAQPLITVIYPKQKNAYKLYGKSYRFEKYNLVR
jgi:hypothetical protein